VYKCVHVAIVRLAIIPALEPVGHHWPAIKKPRFGGAFVLCGQPADLMVFSPPFPRLEREQLA